MTLFQIAREKDVFWKYHYADPDNYAKMDSVMAQIPGSNFEFSNRSFGMSEYYENYKLLASHLSMPVLLYYGKKDYAIGPTHHDDIYFPNMRKVGWKGGHARFMEGREELESAITDWLIYNKPTS